MELPERGISNSDSHIKEIITTLKKRGYTLCIDNFGSMNSPLNLLRDYPIDRIKIDRSFTLKALKNDYEFGLLQHMADMTHSIDSKFCIEGIETEDELNKISKMGPDYIQGYYFGKPCAYDAFVSDYVK